MIQEALDRTIQGFYKDWQLLAAGIDERTFKVFGKEKIQTVALNQLARCVMASSVVFVVTSLTTLTFGTILAVSAAALAIFALGHDLDRFYQAHRRYPNYKDVVSKLAEEVITKSEETTKPDVEEDARRYSGRDFPGTAAYGQYVPNREVNESSYTEDGRGQSFLENDRDDRDERSHKYENSRCVKELKKVFIGIQDSQSVVDQDTQKQETQEKIRSLVRSIIMEPYRGSLLKPVWGVLSAISIGSKTKEMLKLAQSLERKKVANY